jgi:uncharacterized protein YigE (DUF2233 family)
MPVVAPVAPPPRPAPSISSPPRFFQCELGGISFQGVSFDSSSHRLAIADQPNGPASQWSDSQEAGRATNALAAVNGGFFTPEGTPLGRVVSHGKAAGSWNPSSLGGGAWFVQSNGSSAISRREVVRHIPESAISSLLQAGPMLVENGHAVSGLDSTKSSPRTFIAWDGGTRWVIAHAEPSTLAGLSSALATNRLVGMPVHAALNLDGGRSAELWVSPTISGGPVFLRPFWNKPVRNFVLLLPR